MCALFVISRCVTEVCTFFADQSPEWSSCVNSREVHDCRRESQSGTWVCISFLEVLLLFSRDDKVLGFLHGGSP